MFNRKIHFLTSLSYVLFSVIALQASFFAQSTTPSARDLVVNEIKSHAARHVKSNTTMQTPSVVELFRSNTVGLTSLEIAQIYEIEYINQKEIQKTSLWDKLKPRAGWIASMIFALLFIFKGVISKWFTALYELIGNLIYSRFAGSRFLRRRALKHYRADLIDKYHSLSIPFRPDEFLELREVYVPLRMIDYTQGDQLDAYQTIIDRRRIVITGAPGAGKTMLLKYILLSYGEDRMGDWPDAPIPILVELARLNDPNSSLQTELISELRRNNFPRGENFLEHNLRNGKILLLLDGLDEIWSTERNRIELTIKDFLDTYRKCRVVVTCRKTAYNNELGQSVKQVLSIIDFNDYQIQQFLRLWEPKMTADRSAEQLIKALEGRPQIMALARNPLLLTMIAFLYITERYPLPHYRGEFYQKSIELLLRQLHPERNKFHATDKSRVLQEVALYIQDNIDKTKRDSRSIPFETIINKIRELRPNLVMRADQEPDALIKEIQVRSGLLLSFDDGLNYQFAHRSLQEYFAAEKLKGKGKALSDRFLSDSDTWRETVKLWCGLSDNDSTLVLRYVFEKEQLTAFECLGDAQSVDEVLAEQIINKLKSRLEEADNNNDIARVFGFVAANPRPRGENLLSFLKASLVEHETQVRRRAAAKCISHTDLPQSATLLAYYYNAWNEVHAPLVHMGDLAVRDLASLVLSGLENAIHLRKYVHLRTWQEATREEIQEANESEDPKDLMALEFFKTPQPMEDLQAIGTPRAATVFVDLMWNDNEELAASAAWRLATLLSRPDVEDFLHDYKLTSEQMKTRPPQWFRRTFADSINTSLTTIAGRIAYFLEQAHLGTVPLPPLKIDPRLAMPYCADKAQNQINLQMLERRPAMELAPVLSAILKGQSSNENSHSFDPFATKKAIIKAIRVLARCNGDSQYADLQKRLINGFCIATNADPRWHYILLSLRPGLQLEFLTRLVKGPEPTVDNCLDILAAANVIAKPLSTHAEIS